MKSSINDTCYCLYNQQIENQARRKSQKYERPTHVTSKQDLSIREDNVIKESDFMIEYYFILPKVVSTLRDKKNFVHLEYSTSNQIGHQK